MSTELPGWLPMVDLQAQRRRLSGRIEAAITRVLEHGQFILGPEVAELEAALARHVGVRHAIGCASGTDALLLVLMAWGIGRGHAVLVPAFTFAATAEAVALLGATPVLCDVDEATFCLDPSSLGRGIEMARARADLEPRAVIPVDLFGQPADYEAILPIARAASLLVLQDAAQSFGARLHGIPAGRQGDAAATSFYPSKPLGAYGDGGAVLTDDDALAEEIRLLRAHGEPPGRRYQHLRVGVNSRLDTLQAAILLAKLPALEAELAARAMLAGRYDRALSSLVRVPELRPGVASAWAQYTIRTDRRDRLAERLRERGSASAVHYAEPLHRQPAWRDFPSAPGGLPVAEALAARVLSLPMHADLEEADQDRVIGAIRSALGERP